MRILILNPNTSDSVTALLRRHAESIALAQNDAGDDAGDGPVGVQAVTARFGAPYIACEASYSVAGHAALDAWAAAQPHGPFAAVLIGCFGDPGLHALREVSPAPVVGLAEAAFLDASAFGRFAIVTGGERWKPMLERLAVGLGYGERLAGIHTVAPSGAELARDPVGAQALLKAACAEAASRFGADAVLLGGAGLAGQAAGIRASLGLPLVDSVEAGVGRAIRLARSHRPDPMPPPPRPPVVAWTGVSPELVAAGQGPAAASAQ